MSEDTRGIFVCYRRDETAGHAGRLADRLNEHFGEHEVFRDIESLEPGVDFVEQIQRVLDSSEVLIVVIGRNWATVTDAAGRKRLQDPYDYVRMEIATALKRNIRVIPVLVQGASMPSTDDLPDDLAPLTRRNAFELHESSWRDDIRRLVTALESVVGDSAVGGEQPVPSKPGGEAGSPVPGVQGGDAEHRPGSRPVPPESRMNPPERPGRPPWTLMAGLVGLLALMGLGVVAWLQEPANEGEDQALKVPLLKGEKLEAARQKIGEDFELVSSGESSSQPEGVILSQNPKAGTEVRGGEKISVVVSTGPESAQVPEVVGELRSEAEDILRSNGFEVTVKTRESSEDDVGKVIGQFPSGGEAEKGSEVVIMVPENPTSAGANEEAAVEAAIRGHYEAIGANNFVEAYSYFGPTIRNQVDQNSWVASEESYQIQGTTINSLKVSSVSGNQATATVDFSVQDNTGTPRFLITWNLVKEGGRWKLDSQAYSEKIG
jgi:hypothetical protein